MAISVLLISFGIRSARRFIFEKAANVRKIKKDIKAKTGFDCFVEHCRDGQHVFCGSFDTRKAAKEREAILKDKKFDTKIVSPW